MREIVEAEAALFEQKRAHEPRHINERGESEVASLPMLATNLATNRVEERRRSSFDAFREIERWVLENGFLELVVLRNRFARALGFDNYFELKAAEERAASTPAQLTHARRLHRADRRGQRARLAEFAATHGDRRHPAVEHALLRVR